VLAEVHPDGDRVAAARLVQPLALALGLARAVLEGVEAHDDQAGVAELPRVAGGRAVVSGGGTDHVALHLAELDGRRRHLRGLQVLLGRDDGVADGPRLVLEHPLVEDVLEDEHARRGGRVVRRRVVVRGGVQDVLVADLAAGGGQELAGAAQQQVLREVVVALEQRDPLAVQALDDDRADESREWLP
jgi:hypothetical protein